MSVRVDPGLNAVARVRGVHEAQCLVEFQRALAEQHEAEDRLHQLNAQLRAAVSMEAEILGSGQTGALLTLRMTLGTLTDTLVEARDAARSAEQAANVARSTWERAASNLSAVEQLLDRRAAERRAERERLLAKEADDLASQAWLRQRGSAS